MKNKLIAALLLIFILSGCHTMHFKKTPASPKLSSDAVGAQVDNWHHIGIFHLVEFSDPMTKAAKQCKDWDSAIVEYGFVNGLVGGLTFGLYSPWNADMKCRS